MVSLTFLHWLPGKKRFYANARLPLGSPGAVRVCHLQFTAAITWISLDFLRYLRICISSTLLHQATTVTILFVHVKRMVHSNSWAKVQTGQQGGEKEQSSWKQRLQWRGWLSWSGFVRGRQSCGEAFGNLTSCLSAVILLAISVSVIFCLGIYSLAPNH